MKCFSNEMEMTPHGAHGAHGHMTGQVSKFLECAQNLG